MAGSQPAATVVELGEPVASWWQVAATVGPAAAMCYPRISSSKPSNGPQTENVQ